LSRLRGARRRGRIQVAAQGATRSVEAGQHPPCSGPGRSHAPAHPRGFALPLAIAALAILTIMATTVVVFTESNLRASQRSADYANAESLAEGGLAEAAAVAASETSLLRTAFVGGDGPVTYRGTPTARGFRLEAEAVSGRARAELAADLEDGRLKNWTQVTP
jgi:type II secretory pathway component PulK